MRHLAVLILSMTICFSYSQVSLEDHIMPYSMNDDAVMYMEEVVKVADASSKDLFYKTQDWFASTFTDSKEVIQIQNIETGKIIGKGSMKLKFDAINAMGGGSSYIHFRVSVFCKEGKAKIVIDNIIYGYTSSGSYKQTKSPLELYYFRKNGKFVQGKTHVKSKALSGVNGIITSWKNAMIKSSDDNYSDF